jgi:release factor glutamine methyltransferase
MSPETVRAALAAARAAGVDRLDAQLLLAWHLQRPRAWLIAHDEAPLTAPAAAAYANDLARRAAGVPLAYLTGEREFHGLSLAVTPAVLDPRPDTETLVDWALDLLATDLAACPAPQVVDLGTGSGAIALAVKRACPRAVVRATDASADALAVAQANARRLGIDVAFAQGDWWHAVGAPPVHLALANPPYIAEGDPHLASLGHEPMHALVSGADGLEALRRLVAGAGPHLAPGGWLLLEHGHDQAAPVQALLAAHGYEALAERHDLAGHLRCSGGRRPAAHPGCVMVHS